MDSGLGVNLDVVGGGWTIVHFSASDCAILCYADHHTGVYPPPDGGYAEINTPPPLNQLADGVCGLFGCDRW